jgi:hypothetical protein
MSQTGDREAVEAVIRHFPARRREVELLVVESESFRDLCDELVTAEQALAAVDQVEAGLRAERRLEWLSFIRSTLAEIDKELRRFNVIPLGQSRRTPS